MRAMQVSEPGGDFELVEREVPEPGFGEALVRVHACGVCHSESFAKEGGYPGVSHPLVPGHEIAGVIEALGEGVNGWEVGQRVGVGWFGGNCGYCEWCRRGSLIDCENMEIPGITMDGGYADYVVVRASAMASMPDELSPRRRPRCCAPGSRPTTRCARAALAAAIAWPSSGSGAWATWACSSRPSSGFETVAIARGDRQGGAGPQARRPPLHRQHRRRSRPGAGRARRRRRDPVHGHQLRRDGSRVRRAASAAARCSWWAPRWTRSASRQRC